MFKFKNLKATVLLMILLAAFNTNANKYTMVIEPIYPIEQSKQVYKPLSKWLSKKTGHEIEIIIDNNYYFYWRNANGNRNPDFTFDAPHIASYRALKKEYVAIATTIEPLTYHLISLDEPKKGESTQDFMISKTIAMLPHPSLATVYFKQWFTDLFSAPNKNVTALSWQEAVEIVFDGDAEAAIVPNWMFKLYPNFASIKESNSIPGSTFMASPNVPKDVVKLFQEALISLKDDNEGYDVLVELNTEGFKQPNSNNYKDLIKLLPGYF